MTTKKGRKKIVKYSQKAAEFLCEQIEEGASAKSVVLKYPDMFPSYRNIWRWRRDMPEFREMIDAAYESYVMCKIDEIEEISKEKTPQGLEKMDILAYNNDKRARIDVLKFTIAKTASFS